MNLGDDKIYVAHGMIHEGGSFYQCLGKTLLAAEKINTEKIHKTWPACWKKYYLIGKKLYDEN